MLNVSIIGAGNLSNCLIASLVVDKDIKLNFIYNRTSTKIDKLLENITRVYEITPSTLPLRTEKFEDLLISDLIILAVSDTAIDYYVKKLADNNSNNKPCILHCSGATSISAFSLLDKKGYDYGVFYPLMTFSKSKEISFQGMEVFYEESNNKAREYIYELSNILGTNLTYLSSEDRLRLHIAGVFSSNFISYLLGLAFDLAGPSREFLMPLALEALRKSFLLSPRSTRTGPAVREDYHTIESHINLLQELKLEDHLEIYQSITEKIISEKKKHIR